MKKYIYMFLLCISCIAALGQDAPPQSPTAISPNFTWYKKIVAGDTSYYAYSNGQWAKFARSEWVKKILQESLTTVGKLNGTNFFSGYNNFQDIGARTIGLSSYGGSLVPGDVSAGNYKVSSLNSGPFIGNTSYRDQIPQFRWGERAGGGAFVVQKFNGSTWQDVLATSGIDSGFATRPYVDSVSSERARLSDSINVYNNLNVFQNQTIFGDDVLFNNPVGKRISFNGQVSFNNDTENRGVVFNSGINLTGGVSTTDGLFNAPLLAFDPSNGGKIKAAYGGLQMQDSKFKITSDVEFNGNHFEFKAGPPKFFNSFYIDNLPDFQFISGKKILVTSSTSDGYAGYVSYDKILQDAALRTKDSLLIDSSNFAKLNKLNKFQQSQVIGGGENSNNQLQFNVTNTNNEVLKNMSFGFSQGDDYFSIQGNKPVKFQNDVVFGASLGAANNHSSLTLFNNNSGKLESYNSFFIENNAISSQSPIRAYGGITDLPSPVNNNDAIRKVDLDDYVKKNGGK